MEKHPYHKILKFVRLNVVNGNPFRMMFEIVKLKIMLHDTRKSYKKYVNKKRKKINFNYLFYHLKVPQYVPKAHNAGGAGEMG